MKAPASISVTSSLVLAAFASAGTLPGDTNEAALNPGLPLQTATVIAPKKTTGLAQSLPPNPNLSHWSGEIVQLTQAGLEESVVISFVHNAGVFHLSADHIVYLKDLGVPASVIQAMLAHDRERLTQTTNTASVATAAQSATKPADKPAVNLAPAIVEAEPQYAKATVIGGLAKQSETGAAKLDLLPSPKTSSRQVVPAKRKVLFPVREPYPVELTAPIVFLDAPAF